MISVFTPVHPEGMIWFDECHQSLKEQTIADDQWEWVIAPNEGAIISESIRLDPHVKIFPFNKEDLPPVSFDGKNPAIGAKKRHCCERCSGDIYVELDSDDLLVPTCLEKVQAAVSEGAGFVYSDFAEFMDKTWKKRHFDLSYNWEMYDFEYKGHQLHAMRAWPPQAATFLSIYWAPNHVRAWTKETYWKAGGHDRRLVVGDDHSLNVMTYLTIGEKGCKQIEEPLYLYRVHGDGSNTCYEQNRGIRHLTRATYLRTIEDVAKCWAKEYNLRSVDLGGAFDSPPGYESVDLVNADILADLTDPWPFEDGSIGVIRAHHILEHLPDQIHTMNELYRVLAPGGFALIEVPSTDGRGAFQDPTHCSFWNYNSFGYYTNGEFAKKIPIYKGRLQEWWLNDVKTSNGMVNTTAHLICLKPPYSNRPVGKVRI